MKIKMQFGELNVTPKVVERLEALGYTPDSLKSAIAEHYGKSNAPAVYVGTYAKYTNGSIRGLWVSLTTFDNFAEFINFCMAIHADEVAPELMAQDYENFPRQYYCEGFMSEDDFDAIKHYAELCDQYGAEAVDAYCSMFDNLDMFEERYCGEFDSEVDFAYHLVEEFYDFDSLVDRIPSYCAGKKREVELLVQYFDYEVFARELFMTDFYYENGHVFRHQ